MTQPKLARPFKTPAVWVVAPAGVVSSIVLMFSLPGDTWVRLAVWLVVGLLIYVTYGMRGERNRIAELASGVLLNARAWYAVALAR